jgi:hypothetical protein
MKWNCRAMRGRYPPADGSAYFAIDDPNLIVRGVRNEDNLWSGRGGGEIDCIILETPVMFRRLLWELCTICIHGNSLI